jgi:hypothetical protein
MPDGSPCIVLEEHSENDAKAWVRFGRTTCHDLKVHWAPAFSARGGADRRLPHR